MKVQDYRALQAKAMSERQLQDLIIAATNEAMTKADELTSERLGKHTKGMNIPGMM